MFRTQTRQTVVPVWVAFGLVSDFNGAPYFAGISYVSLGYSSLPVPFMAANLGYRDTYFLVRSPEQPHH